MLNHKLITINLITKFILITSTINSLKINKTKLLNKTKKYSKLLHIFKIIILFMELSLIILIKNITICKENRINLLVLNNPMIKL